MHLVTPSMHRTNRRYKIQQFKAIYQMFNPEEQSISQKIKTSIFHEKGKDHDNYQNNSNLKQRNKQNYSYQKFFQSEKNKTSLRGKKDRQKTLPMTMETMNTFENQYESKNVSYHHTLMTTQQNSQQNSRQNSFDGYLSKKVLNKSEKVVKSHKKEELCSKQRKKQMFLNSRRDKSLQITSLVRLIVVDWIMKVCEQLEISKQTFHVAISLLDRATSRTQIKKNEYQLYSACCLYLAYKLDQATHLSIRTFVELLENTYHQTAFLQTEIIIVKALKFKIVPFTAYLHATLFLGMANAFFHKQSFHSISFLAQLNLSEQNPLFQEIIWMVDGVVMENQQNTYNKQYICLSIIYLVLKKYIQKQNFENLDCISKFESKLYLFEKMFERFLEDTLNERNVSLELLQESIVFLEKWSINTCTCRNATYRHGSIFHPQLKKILAKF